MEDMDKVNEMLQPIIDNLQINQMRRYRVSGIRNQKCLCMYRKQSLSFWKL